MAWGGGGRVHTLNPKPQAPKAGRSDVLTAWSTLSPSLTTRTRSRPSRTRSAWCRPGPFQRTRPHLIPSKALCSVERDASGDKAAQKRAARRQSANQPRTKLWTRRRSEELAPVAETRTSETPARRTLGP